MKRDGPIYSFERACVGNTEGNYNYTRYWMGSIVILRILFVFLTYQTIRYINIYVIFLLMFLTTYLIDKKIGFKYAFAFVFSMIAAGIYVIPMSFHYMPVFIITLVATDTLILLYGDERFGKYIPYLFMFIGVFTAYFDLLTSPLLTYGFPIIILILLKIKQNNSRFKELLLDCIKYGMISGFSYGMAHIAKWIIASIVLNSNEITSAVDKLLFRANFDESAKYNRISMIKRNFNLYFNKFVITAFICIITSFLLVQIYKKKIDLSMSKKMLILIIIALIPYFWFLILANHSYIHFWMTYRIQAITMMCILSFIFSLSKDNE